MKVYLAALLHDIGKFYERADPDFTPKSKLLNKSVKDAEGVFCPKQRDGKNEYYSHRHVLYTIQFFEDHRAKFAGLFKDDKALGLERKDTLPKLAGKHHKPDTLLEKIIQAADWLASGMDRRADSRALDDQRTEANSRDYKKSRMHSIFDSIELEGKKAAGEHILKISRLKDYPDLFPVEEFVEPEYAALWKEFTAEFEKIPADAPEPFAATLLALLEKYTTTIPSAATSAPDVSLFDHLKITAGIAVSLYDYLKENKELTEQGLEEAKKGTPFLLIGADLSGIQAFIYNIISKNAAKNLKGRSFYLQALIAGALEAMLTETGLPDACTIYASGGGFFAIGPNTDKVKNTITALRDNLEKGLFCQHNLSLYLAMACTEMSYRELISNEIKEPWKRLTGALNRQKRQRYAGLFSEKKGSSEQKMKDFFEPLGKGAEEQIDHVTGEAIPEHLTPVKLDNEEVAPLTKRLVNLGRQLKKADYWISSTDKVAYEAFGKAAKVKTPGTHIYHYLVSEEQWQKAGRSVDNVRIRCLKGTDFLEAAEKFRGKGNTLCFSFYGGNDFPVKKDEKGKETGEPKTFDELAGPKGEGFRRLGVLRMDVDNLGQIFIRGLPDDKRTLSRYATLSRSLDYFFKGYLNQIWKQKPYKDWTIIIYSGGDDLFIVGRWNRLLRMAQEIHQQFQEWTGYHPAITLSGGMAVVSPKFPVMKGAALSGDAESQAKSHKYIREQEDKSKKIIFEKNSFTLLDFPMHWKNELAKVLEQADRLAEVVAGKKLPSGFLQDIRLFHEMAYPDRDDEPGKKDYDKAKEHLRWRWMMAYHFKRMANRYKNDEAAQLLNCLQTDSIAGNTWGGDPLEASYPSLALYQLAARLAELANRTQDENNYGLTFKNNT